jgi:DNA-binding MarR family transcriptional regulator
MNDGDLIDEICGQWAQERPELDTSGLAVVGRLMLLGRLLERRLGAVLAELELSVWAFDVLATLRRQGSPYQLTPGQLSRATMLTSGAMTNRLDRLEQAGWLRREADPRDRRGVCVFLTDEGRALVDRAIALRLDDARRVVEGLSETQRRALGGQLSALLATLSA